MDIRTWECYVKCHRLKMDGGRERTQVDSQERPVVLVEMDICDVLPLYPFIKGRLPSTKHLSCGGSWNPPDYDPIHETWPRVQMSHSNLCPYNVMWSQFLPTQVEVLTTVEGPFIIWVRDDGSLSFGSPVLFESLSSNIYTIPHRSRYGFHISRPNFSVTPRSLFSYDSRNPRHVTLRGGVSPVQCWRKGFRV